MNGKKIGGWIVRDGIAAVDGTSLPWGPIVSPLCPKGNSLPWGSYSIVHYDICSGKFKWILHELDM